MSRHRGPAAPELGLNGAQAVRTANARTVSPNEHLGLGQKFYTHSTESLHNQTIPLPSKWTPHTTSLIRIVSEDIFDHSTAALCTMKHYMIHHIFIPKRTNQSKKTCRVSVRKISKVTPYQRGHPIRAPVSQLSHPIYPQQPKTSPKYPVPNPNA